MKHRYITRREHWTSILPGEADWPVSSRGRDINQYFHNTKQPLVPPIFEVFTNMLGEDVKVCSRFRFRLEEIVVPVKILYYLLYNITILSLFTKSMQCRISDNVYLLYLHLALPNCMILHYKCLLCSNVF